MSLQLLDTLDRLTKKRGVLASLVLDRQNGGTIIKASGSPAFSRLFVSGNEGLDGGMNDVEKSEENNMQELAGLVSSYIESTERLIGELNVEDEAKFIRLRTKRFELVVVPDTKYLLVVVHETPAA